ncbi:MAG TPA: N-acetyltransferase [Chitinophagaceae bacterium]|jgi:N-acetyltransferase|nr:N-acetyltransferase [Chitinophagaceae bacterium]
MSNQDQPDDPVLKGIHIRLEPMDMNHLEGLMNASVTESSLYRWSPVPQGREEVQKYIQAAVRLRKDRSALPFAIIRLRDETVIGSTRFWNLERWSWPEGHPRHGRNQPDACEIGYSWLNQTAIRTGANTEAKLLLLTYAFEIWQVFRVCFHADVRNERSRRAIERIGGKPEGILRAHRMAVDFIPRDSARYSILEEEWPDIKQRLTRFNSKSFE